MGIVVDRLNSDKKSYLKHQQDLPEQISVASSLAIAFGGPARESDSQTLVNVNLLNSIKSDIVSIGGSTGLGTSRYGGSTSNITSQYGSIVSGTSTATAESLGLVGFGSTTILAYGTVNQDLLKAWNYPKISGGDYSSDYPFDGGSWLTVTSGNVGIGVSTRLFKSDGAEIGIVFDIVSPPVDVSALISQYNSTVGTVNTQKELSSAAKKYKEQYELQVWGLNRQFQENEDALADIEEALGITQDPDYGGPW
jgi:hypothetical protein